MGVRRLPLRPRRRVAALFEQMIREFEVPSSGSELQLRALLVEALVTVIRWEESIGKAPEMNETPFECDVGNFLDRSY